MYKKLALPTISAIFLTSHLVDAAAVNSVDRLEQITVTSSRIEMPLRKVGTSLSVLSAEQIEQKGYTTASEILRSVPSIGISNSGGLGKQSAVRIRGEEGYRTKVFVDGIDISDPTGTQIQPNIQHLLSADIERIEVLRGPQGMMYGADAGGVINITTKKSNKVLEGGLSSDYGRYNSLQLSGNLRGKVEAFDYSLLVSKLSSDGFNAQSIDTALDKDGYKNITSSLSLGYDINEFLRIQGITRRVNSDTEFDNCFFVAAGAFNTSNQCDGDYQQINSRIEVIYDDTTWQHTWSYSNTDTEKSDLADFINLSSDINGQVDQVQYVGAYHFDKDLNIVYGIDFREDSVDDTLKNTHFSRDQQGYYLEFQNSIENRFFYTIGVRNDENDDFGSFTSYRATSAYLIPTNNDAELKLKGSYGTGFRAPSLFELVWNINNAINPASLRPLDQETSAGFDVGVEYHQKNTLFIELVYFDQKIKDAIDYNFSSNSYQQKSGTSKSKGIELSFEKSFNERLSITGNYTLNKTEDSTGTQRVRRPKHIMNLGLQLLALNEQLSINTNVRYIKDTIDGFSTFVDLDDYKVVDINIAYTLMPECEVYLRGENILNEDYQEVSGYNTAGAGAYIGLRYRF